MRSLGTRRAVLVAGVATVAALALAGCSVGQVAETSLKRPSNMGVNADNSNNSVVVRNLAVVYNGSTGYAAGSTAPLQVGLYNNTTAEVTVRISTRPLEGSIEGQGVTSGRMVALSGGAAPSGEPVPDPSASASATPAVQPATITLAALGSETFLPGDTQQLSVMGLADKLAPGQSVNLIFEFSNGAAPLVLQAPVGIPTSPASRAPGNPEENHEPE